MVIAPILDMAQGGNNGELENCRDDAMVNCNDFELIEADACKSTRKVEVDDSAKFKGYILLARKEEKGLKHEKGTRKEMVTTAVLNKTQEGDNDEVENNKDDVMENCDDFELI